MNVQTLPPGYKVAPWTPPEKIDSKMLAEASARLIDLLRIRTQPIGMRLFEDPAEMEKIQGLRKPTEGFKFTMCQMVTQSRWYGFTLGITVDNTRGGNAPFKTRQEMMAHPDYAPLQFFREHSEDALAGKPNRFALFECMIDPDSGEYLLVRNWRVMATSCGLAPSGGWKLTEGSSPSDSAALSRAMSSWWL